MLFLFSYYLLNTKTNEGLTWSSDEIEILEQNQMESVAIIKVYTYFNSVYYTQWHSTWHSL